MSPDGNVFGIKVGRTNLTISTEAGESAVISIRVSKELVIPEEQSKNFLFEYHDLDLDYKLTEEEALLTRQMDCLQHQITDLTGISYFKNLLYLKCDQTNISALDVSSNIALTTLICSNRNLGSLDLSKNTALTELDCRGNALATLDLSKNTALTVLHCESNNLTGLNLSTNTALTKLHCSNNMLTTLSVSANTALSELICNVNSLSTLDLTYNTALTVLNCHSNNLATLDISANTALTHLYCDPMASLTAVYGYLGQESDLTECHLPNELSITQKT